MKWVQKSYQSENEGCLYLVPTPIGNLQDMTFRAVETLKEVDYIAAEDTRQTKKLLNHFHIQQKVVSYHEHNKGQSGKKILNDLIGGSRVAVVSDAGTPGISDPGTDLVKLAVDHNVPVIALPGPNAFLPALVASGLATDHFLFFGFLDRQKKRKKEQLEAMVRFPYTMIFYESPHRIKDTIKMILEQLGNRKMCLTREISKKFEECVRGSVKDVLSWLEQQDVLGELCLVIEGNIEESVPDFRSEEEKWWASLTIQEHVAQYIDQGYATKEAIRQVAQDRKKRKREIYQVYHINE